MSVDACFAPDLRHVSFVGVADPVRPRRVGRSVRSPVAQPSSDTDRASAPHRRDEAGKADPLILWLLEQSGLDPHAYRPNPLQRRLSACLRALHASSPAEARSVLERRAELKSKLLSILLLGVSDFFRDCDVFEYLRESVVPEFSTRSGPLRIWSAGCSDGQELYSVAMLLDELGLLDRSVLLGTDCRTDAVLRASAGIFRPEALTGVEPSLRSRYFRPAGHSLAIHPRIAGGIRWRVADLLTDEAGRGWDMILWRNCAIYLTFEAAGVAWRKLADALLPGGYLITGRAERPANTECFARVRGCVYRRIGA